LQRCVSCLPATMEMKTAAVDLRMDADWYGRFTGKVGSATECRAKHAEDAKERSFDDAEAMEAGEARCSIYVVLQPPVAEQRLVVVRSNENRISTLMNAAGEVLLMSRVAEDGLRFDIYMSHDGTPPLVSRSWFARADPSEPEPTFALVASNTEHNDWALISLQCDNCAAQGRRRCGARHMMRYQHYLEPVGAGQAFCMDLLCPTRRQDGSRAILCPCCGEAAAAWTKEHTSRRPKWNIKNKSLSLDFRGRATKASAKNFQLESAPGVPLLLYGKVGDNKFVLDYCPPLGMVQAFAASLSVSHWQ